MKPAMTISLTRQFATSDEWKVFASGNIPLHDGWISWADVRTMAKSVKAIVPAEYWLVSLGAMREFKPQHIQ